MRHRNDITDEERRQAKQKAVRLGLAVGTVCCLTLLIVTCVKLVPLGKENRNAKGDRNDAKKAFDAASKALTSAKQALADAHKRVAELSCAIDGKDNFNQQVNTFKKQVADSDKQAPGKLSEFWHLIFSPDKRKHNNVKTVQHWTETKKVREWDYFWSCFHTFSCGKDTSCCYQYDWHTVTKHIQHPYTKAVITDSEYKNIVSGGNFKLPELSCGMFSRTFSLGAISNYLAHHSQSTTGTPQTGYVETTIDNTYASQFASTYTLDGVTHKQDFKLSADNRVADVATQLASGLLQFLAAAANMFNNTGSNYSALKQQTEKSINGLLAKVSTANTVLDKARDVLTEKQHVLDTINRPYHRALEEYLPSLFLVPIATGVVVAGLAYVLLTCRRTQDHTTYVRFDNDLGARASDTAYRPPSEAPRTPPPASAPLAPHKIF